jgi:hypothetical protein
LKTRQIDGASTDELSAFAYTPRESLLKDFAARGIVALAPAELGISADVHARVYKKELNAHREKKPITVSTIPDVLEVLKSPGVVSACDQILGENWAIVPFTHNAPFASGARDQMWHKDDNGPYNARKQRHHQSVQIELLYYPQFVREDMGPTATIPYSHYWTFNHEENQDNFAGADHLDFNYLLSGAEREPVNGPDSAYDPDDIVNRRTLHDGRMAGAVSSTKWPLVKTLEAAPLRAGSVIICSHNTFHRGNHRRDDWRLWERNPRFMWRFWLYRTADPVRSGNQTGKSWRGIDPMTKTDLSQANDDVIVLWRYHLHWMQSGVAPPPRPHASGSSYDIEAEANALGEQLLAKHDESEPARIGAAYRLASIADTAIALRHLSRALYIDRESVRRAATYGLIALGPDATDVLLEAARSPIKWVRKAGVHGLGDAGVLTQEVFQAVATCLREDSSVYVRSVAAESLGGLGRRAIATGVGKSLIPGCLEALTQSLSREKNRLCMNVVQNRSLKYARPTDDCDICEGAGVDFGHERFELVRSAVRENVLCSVVTLCSHGGVVAGSSLDSTIQALEEVVRDDTNVISVGFAQDALSRLAHINPENQDPPPAVALLRERLVEILEQSPLHPFEALVRAETSGAVVSSIISRQ